MSSAERHADEAAAAAGTRTSALAWISLQASAWRVPCKTPSERVVLLALAATAGERGWSRETSIQLAARCDMKLANFYRHLKYLVEAGAVERKSIGYVGGGYRRVHRISENALRELRSDVQ